MIDRRREDALLMIELVPWSVLLLSSTFNIALTSKDTCAVFVFPSEVVPAVRSLRPRRKSSHDTLESLTSRLRPSTNSPVCRLEVGINTIAATDSLKAELSLHDKQTNRSVPVPTRSRSVFIDMPSMNGGLHDNA